MSKVFWWFIFLIVLIAGDRLGGWLLQSQIDQSQFRYSRLYTERAGADILLVGNSRGLTFFQPYIEQVTGKTTCNLSYNGMPMNAAQALVLDYLDHYPAPSVLVLDITTCDRENNELLAAFLTYSAHSMRLDTLLHGRQPKVWWGGQVSALFRYNNEIAQRAFFHRNTTDKDWLLDRVIAPALAQNMAAQQNYPLEVHPYLIQQLQQTVAAAQARGVTVHLVISPYFPGFDKKVDNLDALKLAAEQATGLPVHDYRQALSDPACFGDFQHPNKKGSLAYIDLLKTEGMFEKGNTGY